MTAFDLPLDELRRYAPEPSEPADFDAFWRATLADAGGRAVPARFDPVDSALRLVSVEDVTFSGFGGAPIRGWFLAPAASSGLLPTAIEYVAYGGGRSLPFHWLAWPAAGYAALIMDTRGQGSAWSPGDTPDPGDPTEAAGQIPGFVTRGVDRPETWYYRRLVTDAVLAVDAAASHPRADPRRLFVAGISQGGGLALAVAGLRDDVRAACIDVPFLCHWRRAMEITDADPYRELTRYLAVHRDRAEAVLRTTGYVDGLSFAPRAKAPALFSVGLRDEICPPSTVFAAFNRYAGPKELRVWPFNGHEGGELVQLAERFAFLDGLGLKP